MPNPKCGAFNLPALWQDSVRRGLFARNLAKQLGHRDGDEAFAAALLQDMALPLLTKELPNDYLVLLAARDDGRCRLSHLERERFGWDHAKAAGQMGRLWNLPPSLIGLIESHTDEPVLGTGPVDPVAVAVRLSALLPAVCDDAWHEAALLDGAYESLRTEKTPPLVELLERIDAEFSGVAPAMKVGVPTRTLVASYQQLAVAAAS
jgi:hypothetical protein